MSESQQLTRFREVQKQFDVSLPEFQRILPAHIPAHRFMRVSLIALQNNPDLLHVPQGSLFKALMQCAQDGLLPDGREAALVTYDLRAKDGKPARTVVSYQPMIAGIRKKAWNSGELASWEASLVHRNDHFEIILGSDPRIEHKPVLRDRGEIIAVYSIAKFKNGASSMDWMTLDEVQQIRRRSRSPDKGPWATDFGEMVKKTMLRRHSKSLPLSSELDNLVRREDELYEPHAPMPPVDLNVNNEPQEEKTKPKRGRPKLSDFRHSAQQTAVDSPATSVAADSRPDGALPPHTETPRDGAPDLNAELDLSNQAESAGYDAYFNGKGPYPVPKEYSGIRAAIESYREGWERGRQEDQTDDDRDTQGAE